MEYNSGSKDSRDRAVGSEVLFGNNVMIEMGSGDQRVKLGIEICEDAWTPVSPGRLLAMAGAEVILNISASNEVIGKAAYRHKLIGSVSSDCLHFFRDLSIPSAQIPSSTLAQKFPIRYNKTKNTKECNRHA